MFLNQCSRFSRHHGEWLDGKRWNFLVDDAFPDDIMDILVDEDFDEGSMELELDPQDDSDDENTDE